MAEKNLETVIVNMINSIDKCFVFNQNNIPAPQIDKNRNFVGFRKGSHVTGLSDIGGTVFGKSIYIECKTEKTIKTYWKDIKKPLHLVKARSTWKRVKRHKEQHYFLQKMDHCGSFTGVVWSVKTFLELPFWGTSIILKNHQQRFLRGIE